MIAPDLRGHGQGIRARRVFRLADCADDCAATLVELGTGPVIAVGYSMGGPIAQLLWRRHRDLVSGLVFCATTAGFLPNRRQRLPYQSAMLAAVAAARAATLTRAVPAIPGSGAADRAVSLPGSPTRLRRHDWRAIVEAGHSISTYHAGRWIDQVDVPDRGRVHDPRPRGATRPTARARRRHPRRDRPPHRRGAPRLRPTRRSAHVLRDACDDVADRDRATTARSADVDDLGVPARAVAPRPTRAHPAAHHAVERVGITQRERDVSDDREQQADREPVVHERRTLRHESENGSYQCMIEPVISITTIAAPMNVALSFWPGLNLPSCTSGAPRRDHHPRSSAVQRFSRPRSARSWPPARSTSATRTGTGSSRPEYTWIVRTNRRRPTSVESGPAYRRSR